MIRLLDLLLSLIGLIILLPLMILIFIICLIENRSPIFKQIRVGHDQKLFKLVKFRTMKKETRSVATHLVDNSMITKSGNFLRRSKLDEVPQLFNVLIGNMSFVGPRPCLLNQKKLIRERQKRGIFKVKPGITGLAQLSGITMETPTLLAKTDLKMVNKMNLYYYLYYILRTFLLILKKFG